MGTNFVQIGEEVVVNLTNDTVTPDKLASGVTAHDKTGNKITGTMSANVKTYVVTLAKASGWTLLTTLDAEVLDHINDPNLRVVLSFEGEYSYTNYAVSYAVASNTAQGKQGNYLIYGMALRQSSETAHALAPMYYPANKTDTSTSLGRAAFRVSSGKYYFYPYDGFVRAGTHRLTFTW